MDKLKAFRTLPNIRYLEDNHFVLIAGPCVVESPQRTRQIAENLLEICESLNIPLIFKASYRKANRSRLDSFRGIGDEEALSVLLDIAKTYRLPVTTDIHSEEEAALAAGFVDILQIPAFLCRQTALLEAAARTGKMVNIKKGQFMSPAAMQFAADKVRKSGNDRVVLTERGTTFGYQDLVVDFCGIPIMQQFGVPVILDCTHSLQRPNQASGVTGGRPGLIQTLARAGVAAGVDGLFIETHPAPEEALSDGANMLPLDQLKPMLMSLLSISNALSTT